MQNQQDNDKMITRKIGGETGKTQGKPRESESDIAVGTLTNALNQLEDLMLIFDCFRCV